VATALRLLDLVANGARFFVRIPGGVDHHLAVLGVVSVGEKGFAEAPFVVGDKMRGCTEDVRRGAIVALQTDNGGAGEILVKAKDIIDLGTSPAVYGLVVVSDAADVNRLSAWALCEQSQP